MEATCDDGWGGVVHEFVIPGWLTGMHLDVDENVYFTNVPAPEPKPKPDKVVVARPDDVLPPKKVELNPADVIFQQQISNAQAECTKHHNFSESAIDTLANDIMVKFLCRESASWTELRQKCLAANDLALYHSCIEGAASLVSMIVNKVSLFRHGHERTANKQLDALREEVLEKACPDPEVGKLIVRLTANNDKYSFVTEGNLAEMLTFFPRKIPTVCIANDQGHGCEKNEDQVFKDISKVVRGMKQYPILEVDDRTRLLINLIKSESHNEIHELVCKAMVLVKSDAVERYDEGDDIFRCLWAILYRLSAYFRPRFQGHLSRVTAPLFKLDDVRWRYIPPEILEIVEVAEIRRMALGSRFIRRSYFIWAFYELGYGLSPKFRDAIAFTPLDKDVPPYHIYMVAIKIPEYINRGKMQFEHFLYAVIFAKEDDWPAGEEMNETVSYYINDFIRMNDITVDWESSQE